jgi:hypothetical protein
LTTYGFPVPSLPSIKGFTHPRIQPTGDFKYLKKKNPEFIVSMYRFFYHYSLSNTGLPLFI